MIGVCADRLPLADERGRLEPVHARHVDVEQDDGEVVRRAPAAAPPRRTGRRRCSAQLLQDRPSSTSSFSGRSSTIRMLIGSSTMSGAADSVPEGRQVPSRRAVGPRGHYQYSPGTRETPRLSPRVGPACRAGPLGLPPSADSPDWGGRRPGPARQAGPTPPTSRRSRLTGAATPAARPASAPCPPAWTGSPTPRPRCTSRGRPSWPWPSPRRSAGS